jgi:uncharacterized membrane protein YccC
VGGLREEARAALVLDRSRPDWGAGARAAVIVAVPLVVAAGVDRLDIGLFATLGALNVALADPGGRYDLRVEATVAATALMTLALAVTTLLAGLPVVAVLALAAWAFAMAFVAEVRPAGPGVSFVSLVIFIVGLGLPDDPSQLGFRLLWFVAGCAWGVVVTSSLWPVRPDAPARTALSGALVELAGFVRAMPHADDEREAARDRIAASVAVARTAITHRIRGRGHRSTRYVSAIEIADDVQKCLGPLDRAYGALDPPPSSLVAAVAALADGCDELADCVRHDRAGRPDAIERAVGEVTRADLTGDAAVARDVLTTMAADLARPRLVELGGSDRRLDVGTIRHRVSSLLHPESLVFRHALRLAAVVGLAQVAAYVDPFAKSYWIPLTVAVVLKPTFASTVERGLQRIAGTVVGVLVAFGVISLLGEWEWALIAAFVALTFALASLLEVNYALAVMGITPAVILLLSIGGSSADLVLDRLFGTLVGGALALVGGYLLWPGWARSDIASTFGRGAALEGRYLSYVVDLAGPSGPVTAAHREAERARSNADETVRRMLEEPVRRRVDPTGAISYCGRLDALVETSTGLRLALRAEAGAAPTGGRAVDVPLADAVVDLAAAARALGSDVTPARASDRASAGRSLMSTSVAGGEVATLAERIRRDAGGLRRSADELARALAHGPARAPESPPRRRGRPGRLRSRARR